MLEVKEKRSWTVFFSSLFFVLGFSVVFSLVGVLLQSVLSNSAYTVQTWLGRIGGVIIILFGLFLLGLINPEFLQKEHKFKVKRTFKSHYLTSFVFGAAFAVGWTPCVSAALGAILALAATQSSSALILLMAYTLGLGIPFWKFYFPKFDKLFGLEENFEQWYKETNMVWPGKIRVEADEVHYCLHIILRFELELGLLEGSIQVKDLPELWNKKMKEYFGVNIENDKEGVLQDIHWSHGGFGYFSTYALGSIYAAQLYRKMKTEIPGIENEIEKGEFSEIGKWLKEKVHKHGKKHLAEDLIKNICGEGLNIKVYLEYLDKKYKGIYKY